MPWQDVSLPSSCNQVLPVSFIVLFQVGLQCNTRKIAKVNFLVCW